MAHQPDPKKVIDDIRREIEDAKGTHIWRDYVNALKLVSQVIFTRSSGFILEFIQNAEDAALGLSTDGVFEIKFNKERLKIVHNSRPFSDEDVRALCGIRSSKKPEMGTLGYLGIGFKSVFKITDRPEIYSNSFQFKFDRDCWENPDTVPWQVIPIWIDQSVESIDSTSTTFIVPYREKSSYSLLLREIKNLRTELYLFLRWLKRIEVTDEVSGQKWTIENKGETKAGLTVLKQDGKEQWFKFFRRAVEVPGPIRDDRDSQEHRRNVRRRDIAIAFSVDSGGNLAPSVAGAMYGGVYSFLPLGEARSGAKFPIQADFLVQPGRDAINYETKWNHWLVEEIAQLCQEAVQFFKQHEKWKYQFLPAFEFTKTKGLESYERLFGPKLIEPIEKFLEGDECVPTVDSGWGKPKNVVRLNETSAAIDSLISRNILAPEEIAPVMGGQDGLKIAHPNVKERALNRFRQIDRSGLLNNGEFLKRKAGTTNAAGWFSSLYLWLHQNPAYELSGRTRLQKRYHDFEIVLTADRMLRRGGEVILLDNPQIDPSLTDVMNEFTTSRPLVHPDILTHPNNMEDKKALRGFLTGLAGVQLLDSKVLCKEALLPTILVASPKPASDEIVKYTTYCKTILAGEIPKGIEFWVLTKFGDIRAAKQVFFSKEFRPEQDWERYQEYVHGLSFINPSYVARASTDQELKEWREFFRLGGIKDEPDNVVEEFAVNYAQDKLKACYTHITQVEKRNYGYDLEAKTVSGETIHIEVKGRSSEPDVDLTGNETEAADKYGDTFYLCVVPSIPNHPAIYMVKNPSRFGKKEKLTITVKTWKAYPWS